MCFIRSVFHTVLLNGLKVYLNGLIMPKKNACVQHNSKAWYFN